MFPKIEVPPKSSILIGFSIINHPFWGTPIFGNTQMEASKNGRIQGTLLWKEIPLKALRAPFKLRRSRGGGLNHRFLSRIITWVFIGYIPF